MFENQGFHVKNLSPYERLKDLVLLGAFPQGTN